MNLGEYEKEVKLPKVEPVRVTPLPTPAKAPAQAPVKTPAKVPEPARVG